MMPETAAAHMTMSRYRLNYKKNPSISIIVASVVMLLAAMLLIGDNAEAARRRKRPVTYPHIDLVKKYAREASLPSSLLRAVIKTESNFNRYAVSPKGAKGLMQLMPGVIHKYGVTDPFNPEQNVKAGSAYLRDMIDRFEHLTLGLAAYNSGPDAVERHKGVPRIAETRAFVRTVYKYYNLYRREIYRHAPQFVPTWPKYEKKKD